MKLYKPRAFNQKFTLEVWRWKNGKRAYWEFGLQAVPKKIEGSNLTYTILNHYDSYLVAMVGHLLALFSVVPSLLNPRPRL